MEMGEPMNRHVIPIEVPARRRRPARPLASRTVVPAERTAAAMDDAAEAERLIEDLLALVDAGLVAPVVGEPGGAIRYAVAGEPDDLEAA
jgi:hypothetical protein